MAGGANRAAYQEKPKGAIPEKYSAAGALKATVGKTAETIDFKLESK